MPDEIQIRRRPSAPAGQANAAFDALISGLEKELPDQVWDLFALSGRVISLAHLFEGLSADGLGESGLNPSEQSVLGILRSRTADTPSKLAKLVHQSPAGMTRTLDRLERKHLIERRADPQNLRQVKIVLTESGREIGERKLKRQTEAISEAFDDMDPASIEQADRLLREILERLSHDRDEKRAKARAAS